MGRLPRIDLEIVQPSTAEFGVAEPERPTVAQPPTAPSTPPSLPPAAAPTQPPGARPAKSANTAHSLAPRNAFPEAGSVGRLAPHGSQIALRLDLESLESMPIASEVRAILSAVPDVRALLEGSGVDPMHDLSRLFLASPDLRREHVILAGRYRGGEGIARAAVSRLAEQRGERAPWRTQHGIPTARWFNSDATPRILALVGPGSFAIMREEDLPRVLAVADEWRQHAVAADASDSLVHMAERELMNISIDNARSYVRGARATQVPERLNLSIRAEARAQQSLEVSVQARFPTADEARAALEYWTDLRDRYASHPLVELFGVASLLREAHLSSRGSGVVLRSTVSLNQARLLLRIVRDSLHTPTNGSHHSAP